MVKRCSVCSHPLRSQIDRDLLSGVPYRSLAQKYGPSPSALCRHNKHLLRQRELERRRQEQAYQSALLEKLALLDNRLDRLFNSALDLRSLNVSLGCVRESVRLLTLAERCRLHHGGAT